jgi:hypothetical protein
MVSSSERRKSAQVLGLRSGGSIPASLRISQTVEAATFTLGWCVLAERFAWAAVEFGRDNAQVFTGVEGQVGALGEKLPQQTVCIFVGAALPGLPGSQK